MVRAISRIAHRLRSLIASDRGNIAMIFGLSAVPLFLAAGMGIDMWRAYAVKVRLEAALDAAALAVGSTSPGTGGWSPSNTVLTNRLQNFFTANYPASALGTPSTPTMTLDTSNSNALDFSVTATVPTVFMTVVGINSLTVGVTNQVVLAQGLEVALVLDNTGSMMCGDSYPTTCNTGVPPSHMDTLRTDAQDMINALFSQTPDVSKLYVAIVPYVTAVNVSTAMTTQTGPMTTSLNNTMSTNIPQSGSKYVDYNGNAILDANGNNITYDSSGSQTSTEWIGCVVEPTTSGEDTSGNGPDITEPSGGWTPTTMGSAWTPYYWVSGTNNSSYPNGWTSSGSTSIPNVWAETVTTCVTGGSAKGTGGCSSTKSPVTTINTSVLYTEVDNGDYANDSSGAIYTSYGPNLSCPMPMIRLTNNQTTLINAAAGLKSRANSGTAITVGMIWGWRALSPNPPFADGHPYNTTGWTKAVVLETDGNAEVFGNTQNCPTCYSGYGYISAGKLGSTTSGPYPPSATTAGTANAYLQSRLTTLCNNMKAQGIVIYTIGLGVGASNTQLEDCAGNGGQFFPAPTGAALTSAFQQIAAELNDLRLSK